MTLFRFRSFIALLSCCLLLTTGHVAAQDDRSGAGSIYGIPGYGSSGTTQQNNQQIDGRGVTPRQGSGAAFGNGMTLPRSDVQSGQGGLRLYQQDATSGLRDATNPDLIGRRPPAAPPKPSEFQKFVESATGRSLPYFGASFFADAYDTFAPVDNVPVSADYVVGPGDEVMIRAWGSIDVDYRATVDRNGLINIPRVGSVNVAGVKAADLEKHLKAQIGRFFTNFNLNVALGQLRGVKVFVVGPAQRPGVYTLSSQSTLLSAVVAAGGPGPNGSMRKISLRRNDQIISELDVYEFLVRGDKSKDMQLAAGDVVVFQAAGPRVAIHGAIDTPAIYELKTAQEPLRDVLRYAGGAPVLANPNRAQLERIDPARQPAPRFVEVFNLDDAGLQKPMRDGDVLTLLQISPQFANAVTLRGHVAQPLRYPYTPGMRIRDLIPDRDALISPDFYRRKNLLVQTVDEVAEEAARKLRLTQSSSGRAERFERTEKTERPDGSTFERTERLVGSSAADRDERTDQSERSTRRDRDSERSGVGSIRRGSAAMGIDGERDFNAVSRARRPPAPLFEELNWDYAVIERLNPQDLSTQIIPFNLGAVVLRGDAASNVELIAGDVVTVFSQKDLRVPVAKQTRLVSIEGEVAATGVYQLLPGETLKQLISRVGGFTSQAYVYGLEFAREETRRQQRENLQSATQRLEVLAATQAAREAANQRLDEPANRSTTVSAAATQAQLQRLRTLEPNGRIALELDYNKASFDALPDVPLEAGDRITVPSRPAFVTVAGAVANNNAYLWKMGRTVNDYLKLAGVEESAETSAMFVLRADGTVTHAGDRRGFLGLGGGIGSVELFPGDALVVPNQLDFETWGRALVRNLKDFSQIFYQFGLGAAAIVTLRR
jgi:polysaccharide export outer membrane protein